MREWLETQMRRLKSPHLPSPRLLLRLALAGFAGLVLLLLVAVGGFFLYDRANPLPLDKLDQLSAEMVDKDGALLRAFTTGDGQWRLKADLAATDPDFIKLLIAYEDKRFYRHHGVDPLAVVRAGWQWLSHGRIISGASTLTMQVARLLEPRERRSLTAKARQMARALQLEQRFTKQEILGFYLTLAPYGGNLEGVRAASLAYFGKEPRDLSLSEAALLVALPQSPEVRRPDLRPGRARTARDTVLRRVAKAGVIDRREVARAAQRPVPKARLPLPHLAAHMADRMRLAAPDQNLYQTGLDRDIQARLETVARDAVKRFAPRVSLAMVLANGKSGRVLAEIGSPDYVSIPRAGWVDMSRAMRSPGSALKPFIYGLAFEEGLVRPETLISDRPVNFGGYRPKNFDMDYQGEVSVREALLQSLNVPAVSLLDAVGPLRLLARLRQSGVELNLPGDGAGGLAIGLGGVGITLYDLTQLFTTFVNDGVMQPLFDEAQRRPGAKTGGTDPKRVLEAEAAFQVRNILRHARPPKGAAKRILAYKTGTSYGYRDAWSVGFDGRHVLGVWVGRADNSAVPGITGWSAAAPILFEAFGRSGLEPVSFAPPPRGFQALEFDDLPVTLKRFVSPDHRLDMVSLPEPAPRFSFPPDGAQIEINALGEGRTMPLVLKIQDGRPPFHWLANGQPFFANKHKRRIAWQPDGLGQSTLTVIDAAGRAASVSVFLRAPE